MLAVCICVCLCPHQVHHIGIYGSSALDSCILYYNRLPAEADCDVAVVLDPLIASGNTMEATLTILKEWGVKRIKVMSVVATAEGTTSFGAGPGGWYPVRHGTVLLQCCVHLSLFLPSPCLISSCYASSAPLLHQR